MGTYKHILPAIVGISYLLDNRYFLNFFVTVILFIFPKKGQIGLNFSLPDIHYRKTFDMEDTFIKEHVRKHVPETWRHKIHYFIHKVTRFHLSCC